MCFRVKIKLNLKFKIKKKLQDYFKIKNSF